MLVHHSIFFTILGFVDICWDGIKNKKGKVNLIGDGDTSSKRRYQHKTFVEVNKESFMV